MSVFFYVYRLDLPESGEFYFGSRTCKCIPGDDNYWGSMKRWKPDKTKLKKTILRSDFESHDEMIEFEKQLILENKNNSLNRNYAIPSAPFYLTKSEDTVGEKNGFFGKHHTSEHRSRISEKLKGEKNPSFGKRWVYRDGEQKFVSQSDFEQCLSDGWIAGSLTSTGFSVKRVWFTNGSMNRYVKAEDVEDFEKSFLDWRRGKTYSETAKSRFTDQLAMSKEAVSAGVKNRLTGTIYITNGISNLRLLPSAAETYLQNGWRRGRWQAAWNKRIQN